MAGTAPALRAAHRGGTLQGRWAVLGGRCPKPSVIRKLKIFQAYATISYFLEEKPASQSKLRGGVLRFFGER